MKKIALMGSTGSIGTQALKIIKDKFKINILTCGENIELFRSQLKVYKPELAVTKNKNTDLEKDFPEIEFLYGRDGLQKAASEGVYDIMLNAIVGIAGLLPTYESIKRGIDVALANKESLVTGGDLLTALSRKTGAKIIPVDSEHSAIFQCLQANRREDLNKIIITASGGPFLGYSREGLKKVTIEDALKHPNWAMGSKITIDSATLMNKGLEVIEAKWLFDLKKDQIEVMVHPSSIVHSLVEFKDRAILAQLGTPDMGIPIAYSLSYPERWVNSGENVDLLKLHSLEFLKPDLETFKPLRLAFELMDENPSYSIVMNAANEILVEKFLENRIAFLEIGDILEETLQNYTSEKIEDIESILELDQRIKGELACL